MITVTYRFKNDRPSIPPSKFVCDKIEQYDTFMRTYGRTIIVETDSTKRYDSPVAMPMPVPWWYGPGDNVLLGQMPKKVRRWRDAEMPSWEWQWDGQQMWRVRTRDGFRFESHTTLEQLESDPEILS